MRQRGLAPTLAGASGSPSSVKLAATCLVLLLSFGFVAAADEPEAIFRQAEDAFGQGVASQARVQEAHRHFARAADLFRQLHEQGIRSSALYRDLGNAEYLAGRWARALWAYHCGLRLDPNDRRLREGLALARARVPIPPGSHLGPPADTSPLWLPRPTPRLTVYAALLGYALACVLGTLWLLSRRRALLVGSLLAVMLLMVSLGGYWYLSTNEEDQREHPVVIVTEENIELRLGNGPSYPPHSDLPPLPRGLEVRQRIQRGDWHQVELPGGAVGWLPDAAVLVVTP